MSNKLPHAVLTGNKVGFDIPAHEWLRGRCAPSLWRRCGRPRRISGLFRADEAQGLCKSTWSGESMSAITYGG